MTEITIHELYELYVDTLERCTPAVRRQSDEELLCNLFEEFATSAWSFLHEISLDKLRSAGLIDDDMVEQSKEVRRRWLELERREWTTEEIRSNAEWNELFNLCDFLKQKVTDRNSGPSSSVS
jgi:hypothetical protein